MLQIPKDIKDLLRNLLLLLVPATKTMRPNIITIASCQVVGPNQVLFTDYFFNKTYKNLLENSQVALSFWDQDGKKSLSTQGKRSIYDFR